MATYNGAEHVESQVRSVLDQLDPEDALVIVDDASTDDTVAVLEAIADDRIHLVCNIKNGGHVAAFERALSLADGEYVFLADQDDIWPPGRIARMSAALDASHFVAGSQDTELLGGGRPSVSLEPSMGGHTWRNILGLFLGRRAYFGCAMGMRREFLEIALPFPRSVEAHDHWLAIAANAAGPFEHFEEAVVHRRLHGSNLTPLRRRDLRSVARTRWLMLLQTIEAKRRVRRRGHTSG
jgi:glycosyltransferase involved in cell wall biosynthesis